MPRDGRISRHAGFSRAERRTVLALLDGRADMITAAGWRLIARYYAAEYELYPSEYSLRQMTDAVHQAEHLEAAA